MILFVDQSGQPGGAELCLLDLARSEPAHRQVLLFSDGPFAEMLRQAGVTVEILPLPETVSRTEKKTPPWMLLVALPPLLGFLRALIPRFRAADLLYFNTAKALLLGTLANFFVRKPAVFHLHDLWERHHFHPLAIRLLVTAANRSRAVIANSQIVAETYRAAGGTAPVTVIPNGFEVAEFDAQIAAGESRTALRAIFNPLNRPVAAIFGRLSRWKGQDILIRAARQVPELVVWVVGDALYTGDDRAYAAELKRLAEDLGDRIQFLGFRNDVPSVMNAADFIVHASVAPEPFGRVLVEGMLARKPVLAADAGGPREILENGQSGLLLPAGDVEALAGALTRLLADPEMGKAMGICGRRRAVDLFALDLVRDKTDALLSSLTDRP